MTQAASNKIVYYTYDNGDSLTIEGDFDYKTFSYNKRAGLNFSVAEGRTITRCGEATVTYRDGSTSSLDTFMNCGMMNLQYGGYIPDSAEQAKMSPSTARAHIDTILNRQREFVLGQVFPFVQARELVDENGEPMPDGDAARANAIIHTKRAQWLHGKPEIRHD